MTSTAFQDALNAITDPTEAQVAATLAMQRADFLRQTQASDDATLRAAIGTRVTALQAAVSAATTDQATATGLATSEAATATAVAGSTPVVNLAYVTAMRDQIAALHTTLAGVETWRAQMDAGYALATTATADLATVVATKL